MVVVRSLFDLVEYKDKIKYYGITENATVRNTVLDYHFTKVRCRKEVGTSHWEGKRVWRISK